MKKNIFKKAGRVFTSLALAVSICLTMSVSVFAKNGNDLENKKHQLSRLSLFCDRWKRLQDDRSYNRAGRRSFGKQCVAEVYAKVDMDGLNAAMKGVQVPKIHLSCTRIHICHVMKIDRADCV